MRNNNGNNNGNNNANGSRIDAGSSSGSFSYTCPLDVDNIDSKSTNCARPSSGTDDYSKYNGYNLLEPQNWFIPQPRPPVCVSNGDRCRVCPTSTSGLNPEISQWDESRTVTASCKTMNLSDIN